MGAANININELKTALKKEIEELKKHGLLIDLPAQKIPELIDQVCNVLMNDNVLPEDFNLNSEKTMKALGKACVMTHLGNEITSLENQVPNLKLNYKFDMRLLFKNEADLNAKNDPDNPTESRELKHELKKMFKALLNLHPKTQGLPENTKDALADELSEVLSNRLLKTDDRMLCENPAVSNVLQDTMSEMVVDLMGIVDVGPGNTIMSTKSNSGTADATGSKTRILVDMIAKNPVDTNIEEVLLQSKVMPDTAPKLTPFE